MTRPPFTFAKWLNHFKEGRPVYYLADLCKISGHSVSSMRKTAQRLVRHGLLKKVGKELYFNTLLSFSVEDLSTLLYRPSYITSESALFYHGVIAQSPFLLTCVTTRPTRQIKTPLGIILYQHLKPSLFFGYQKESNHFVAKPEKAVLDFIYLSLKNGRSFSTDEWNQAPLSKTRLTRMARKFPKTVQHIKLGARSSEFGARKNVGRRT